MKISNLKNNKIKNYLYINKISIYINYNYISKIKDLIIIKTGVQNSGEMPL